MMRQGFLRTSGRAARGGVVLRTRRAGMLVAATLLLSFAVASSSGLAGGAGASVTGTLPAIPTSLGSLTYAKLSSGALGLLNLRSGAFIQFGNSVPLVGLGIHAGTLYSDTTGSGTLYKLNPRTGNLTPVGSAGIGFEEFGSTTRGLFAIDPGMTLYAINPATGAATPIGPTGLAAPDHGGLSSGSSTLYIIQQFGTSRPIVYTLDTSTGAATRIGTTSGAFGPVVIKGKLYSESWTRCTINPSGICAHSMYSFNPVTGHTVFVSNVRTPMQVISDGLAPFLPDGSLG